MTGLTTFVPDSETVYRRVPPGWTADNTPHAPWVRFRPTERDVSGISLDRASLCTPQESARRGNPSRAYAVFALRVEAIRSVSIERTAARMDVVGDPLHDNPAHAQIPQMRWAVYVQEKALIIEWANRLAQLSIQVA